MRRTIISLLFLAGGQLAFAGPNVSISTLTFDQLIALPHEERMRVGLDACDGIVRHHILFMGHLANEQELERALLHLNNHENQELVDFTRALFWLEYGNARLPRRYEAISQTACWQTIHSLTLSTDLIIQGLAFAALARSSACDDELCFQEKVNAFNSLVDRAPQSRLTYAIAGELYIDAIALSRADSPSLEALTRKYGWTGSARATLINTPIGQLGNNGDLTITRVLEILSANETIASNESYVDYIRQLAELPDLEIQPNSAEGAFALLVASVRLEQWDRAKNLLIHAVHASIPLHDYLETLNKVGMAFAKAGADAEAQLAFQSIAHTFHGTQAAAYAIEHIAHIDETSVQELE